MPCAAPCNRLPCDERCQKRLSCGHQCPGLCGETCCPKDYCQSCGSKGDDRVDLLEFKSYSEIDLDETPIVVLSCGHFFTAESLDGLVGLGEVYEGETGSYTGLRESSALVAVPGCPDCKRPIRQFATQRYNRVINRAVMDETSRKLLVKADIELEKLEQRLEEAEALLQRNDEAERPGVTLLAGRSRPGPKKDGTTESYKELEKLETLAAAFCKEVSIERQPSKKLSDAIKHAKSQQPLDAQLASMHIDALDRPTLEKRVVYRGRIIQLRIQDTILRHRLIQLKSTSTWGSINIASKKSNQLVAALLKGCEALILECAAGNLPRLAVQGSIVYAQITVSLRSLRQARNDTGAETPSDSSKDYAATALKQLDTAVEICGAATFAGAERLHKDAEKLKRLLGREWYEPVTEEEKAAIKMALVGKAGGIHTNSGHWYNCQNGHPVSNPQVSSEYFPDRFRLKSFY